MPPPPVLVVFSHLRWGFVYQRPQQLLSRLADRWHVVFVEEPGHTDGRAWLDVQARSPNLQVLVPHTPVAAPGFHDDQLGTLQALLGDHLQARRLSVDVAWLYTPMALPLVATVDPPVVVYDCMDELTAFLGAPRQLAQRESALMKQAAFVLTGGPSLYEARRHLHQQVECVPSAVDAAHFDPARLDADSEPAREVRALQDHLPGPRIGFYGVIDERLDLGLVDHLAQARPDWSVVMAGPVVKVSPQALPRRPNLHWLGMQPYARLPYLLSGWDVATMPFALNEATRFISPTKTLEYMAGGKPVASTPIRDVVGLWGHAVRIAEAGPDFVRACESLLAEDEPARERRRAAMRDCVATQDWTRSADRIHALLVAALARGDDPGAILRAPAVGLPARPEARRVAAGGSARA